MTAKHGGYTAENIAGTPVLSFTCEPMRFEPSLAGKKVLRLDDEVRFIRSWLEKPLAIGAVTPSGRFLARTMARYVDPDQTGPVIELGPGTGPVTEALVERGIEPKRLVLVEFNPGFCRCCARASRKRRWCRATPIV